MNQNSSDDDGDRFSVADALFSGTRQALFRLLFGQPDKSYTLSELIEMAQSGRGAVQREISRLVEAGLVRQKGRSRGRQYMANPDAAIFEELCGITRKILGPSATIRDALEPLGNQIRLALLYGSVARHDDHAESDIDVLIVSDELLLEDVFKALAETERSLGRAVNPTVFTRDEFERRRTAKNSFITDVLQGQHELLLGNLD